MFEKEGHVFGILCYFICAREDEKIPQFSWRSIICVVHFPSATN